MGPRSKTNFETFLEHTSPLVSVQNLPKKRGSSSSTLSATQDGHFGVKLGDIWKAYEEWSTFGAGVPLTLDGCIDSRVVQYYTPSLSAMQIFTKKPFPAFASSRSLAIGRNNDEKKPSQVYSHNTFDNSHLTMDQLGYLYFQYNETLRPFERAPLAQKVAELAEMRRGAISLKCSNLSPYSWFAVAWYPIYQIPTAKGVKELSASFLTYHSLTPFFSEALPQEDKKLKCVTSSDGMSIAKALLPPFGVVTYKLFGRVWIDPGTSDQEKIEKHEESAASWLETLKFRHSDFDFFMSRRFFGPAPPCGR